MSPITLGMDGLLALLLLAALAVGLQLHRRLSNLRDSQDGFAKAVQELNAAAVRADAALKALRAASEDTHDALLQRIETARGLILRLEKASDAAEAAAKRAETAKAEAPVARILAPRRLEEERRPLEAPVAPSLRRPLEELLAGRAERLAGREVRGRAERPQRKDGPDRVERSGPRRRLLADEDLFEEALVLERRAGAS